MHACNRTVANAPCLDGLASMKEKVERQQGEQTWASAPRRPPSSCRCPERCVAPSFAGPWNGTVLRPFLGFMWLSLLDQRGQVRKHPFANLAHVLVGQQVVAFMGTIPCTARLVVMLAVVFVVGATRDQVPRLVNELQPHHRRPRRQQNERGAEGFGGWEVVQHGRAAKVLNSCKDFSRQQASTAS